MDQESRKLLRYDGNEIYQKQLKMLSFQCSKYYFDCNQQFQEVKDTLDKGAIFRCMTLCYEAHQSEKPSLEELSPTAEDGSVLKSARSLAVVGGSILQGFVVRFIGIFSQELIYMSSTLMTISVKAAWSMNYS